MKRLGIIGNGADKFTEETRAQAKELIHKLLAQPDVCLVSGRSPMGGVDVWAEEEADFLNRPKIIHAPTVFRWKGKGGYQERNLAIAGDSDEVHVIVAKAYPPDYQGQKFKLCYHCDKDDHVKSGACWTRKKAQALGKPTYTHII